MMPLEVRTTILIRFLFGIFFFFLANLNRGKTITTATLHSLLSSSGRSSIEIILKKGLALPV